MISYIKGTVEFAGEEYAVIDNGGIGYKLHMPLTQITALPYIGKEVKVYTYMYVREDILDLYGFISEEALHTFQMLISVNGVGPKAAMSVLSVLTPHDFAVAVTGGDHKSISQAQGVGGKTAQRIVLELKDKVGKGLARESDGIRVEPESNIHSEAVNALVALGYSYGESKQALEGVYGETTEELIKAGLRQLMR
ncbi:MAG: Holliday junction branch migration protein RuvA [Bacillota bacterium]|nr:Holliday junction branch migration protein RuvA [Bacillota bacterium]